MRKVDAFPIGSKVKWRDEIWRTSWRGTVTGHASATMLHIDGPWQVSCGLLEVTELAVEIIPPERTPHPLETVVMEQLEIIARQQRTIEELQWQLAEKRKCTCQQS